MDSVNLEAHEVWRVMTNKKLQSIYNYLRESFHSVEHEDAPKLFELLETVNEMQENHHSAMERILSIKETIGDRRNDLQVQMQLLEKSTELLKLHTSWSEKADEGGASPMGR